MLLICCFDLQIREKVLRSVGGWDTETLRSHRERPSRRDWYAQEANRWGEPLQRRGRVLLAKCPTSALSPPLTLHTAYLLTPVPLPKKRAVRGRIFTFASHTRVQKLDVQLDDWSKKYDKDTEHKDKELSQLKQSKARDLDRLQELTRKACNPPFSCRAHWKSRRTTKYCTLMKSKSLQSTVEFQCSFTVDFPQWSHMLERWRDDDILRMYIVFPEMSIYCELQMIEFASYFIDEPMRDSGFSDLAY